MADEGRLTLTMGTDEMIRELFEGNSGSEKIFEDLAERLPALDPHFQPGMHAEGHLAQWIDDLRLYGDKLWCFNKNVCGGNPDFTVAVLRGAMLGIVSRDTVQQALDPKSTAGKINSEEIAREVQRRIPEFAQIVPLVAEYKGPPVMKPDDPC